MVTVIGAAATRAAGVLLAGVALVLGFALLLWAITPTSGGGPVPMLRGGITAFGAAHLVGVHIGDGSLTVSPLLITGLIVALLASTGSRGRRPTGLAGELAAVVTTAVVYGVLVALTCAIGAAPGSVPHTVGLTAAAIALVAGTAGTLARGTALKAAVRDSMPLWVWQGLRAGLLVAAVVFAGGMVAFVASLGLNVPSAATLADTLAPSMGGGFGLTLLGIVYLPNAGLAAVGYVTGVGFEIGAGHYSPFGSTPAELPPIPMLVGAPDNTAISYPGLAGLLVPVIAAVVAGIYLSRRIDHRVTRLFAVGVAGMTAGLVALVLVRLAGGGIAPGPWEVMGAPATVGGIVALFTWVVGGAWAATAKGVPVAVGASRGGEGLADDGFGADDEVAPDADTEVDTADADADTEIDTADADADADVSADADGETEADPDDMTEAEAEAEADDVIDAEVDADGVTEADDVTDADVDADGVTDSDDVTDADADHATDADDATDAEIEGATDVDPDDVPATDVSAESEDAPAESVEQNAAVENADIEDAEADNR
ncbi:hypothetical protein D1871_06800 [Nakamurella silvestris]|nr:hypothetical protein D1871_06800 [Nakamurella silvestris]